MTATPAKTYLLRNLRAELKERERDPGDLVARQLKLDRQRISQAALVQRNLDARKGRPRFVLQIRFTLDGDPPAKYQAGHKELVPWADPEDLPPPPLAPAATEVALVGSGPAGLFAALRLCQAGLRPVLLERGPAFPARHRAISSLQEQGVLDPEANFHFGLGGAGTYSDGKLYTRSKKPIIRHILSTLQRHGGGSREQILVDAHPHVGTDRWPPTLESLVAELESQGCRFLFDTQVQGFKLSSGKLVGLELADGIHPCQAAIVAPGNSARGLFEAFHGAGLPIQTKAFAVGVRMTQPQHVIDRIQYGKSSGHPMLEPAAYRLRGQFKGRGVYSFCMCPGGTVVPTPTEEGGLAINGMSSAARDSGEANAAIVVETSAEELEQAVSGTLAGVAFQRGLERAAFEAGGGAYRAPAQGLGDFLNGRPSGRLSPCGYRPGINPAQIDQLLPAPLVESLRAGLAAFCKKMPGLKDPHSLLLGLETRTSSPVRLVREPDGMSPGAQGLFPAGEGAGYAGGIASSAADGIRAADALLSYCGKAK